MFQKKIILRPFKRGFHIITSEIDRIVGESKVHEGMCNVFIQHTSASLTINENADPTVRKDFETHFNRMIPEGENIYTHSDEGDDDMPAHLKNSLLGCSLNIPIINGSLALGIWQGIYICEHRDYARSRNILITIW